MIIEVLYNIATLNFGFVIDLIMGNLVWIFLLATFFFVRFNATSARKQLGQWIVVFFMFDTLAVLGIPFIGAKYGMHMVLLFGTGAVVMTANTKFEKYFSPPLSFVLLVLLSLLFA
jgi:hypothetical protein